MYIFAQFLSWKVFWLITSCESTFFLMTSITLPQGIHSTINIHSPWQSAYQEWQTLHCISPPLKHLAKKRYKDFHLIVNNLLYTSNCHIKEANIFAYSCTLKNYRKGSMLLLKTTGFAVLPTFQ